jgi:hypothetical protein
MGYNTAQQLGMHLYLDPQLLFQHFTFLRERQGGWDEVHRATQMAVQKPGSGPG